MAYTAPVPTQPDHTAPAFRVATTIGVVKWIVVGIHGLVGLLALFVGFFDGGPFVSLLVPLVSGLSALVAWAMFGWAQHTLNMLATIARNTRHGAL